MEGKYEKTRLSLIFLSLPTFCNLFLSITIIVVEFTPPQYFWGHELYCFHDRRHCRYAHGRWGSACQGLSALGPGRKVNHFHSWLSQQVNSSFLSPVTLTKKKNSMSKLQIRSETYPKGSSWIRLNSSSLVRSVPTKVLDNKPFL